MVGVGDCNSGCLLGASTLEPSDIVSVLHKINGRFSDGQIADSKDRLI